MVLREKNPNITPSNPRREARSTEPKSRKTKATSEKKKKLAWNADDDDDNKENVNPSLLYLPLSKQTSEKKKLAWNAGDDGDDKEKVHPSLPYLPRLDDASKQQKSDDSSLPYIPLAKHRDASDQNKNEDATIGLTEKWAKDTGDFSASPLEDPPKISRKLDPRDLFSKKEDQQLGRKGKSHTAGTGKKGRDRRVSAAAVAPSIDVFCDEEDASAAKDEAVAVTASQQDSHCLFPHAEAQLLSRFESLSISKQQDLGLGPSSVGTELLSDFQSLSINEQSGSNLDSSSVDTELLPCFQSLSMEDVVKQAIGPDSSVDGAAQRRPRQSKKSVVLQPGRVKVLGLSPAAQQLPHQYKRGVVRPVARVLMKSIPVAQIRPPVQSKSDLIAARPDLHYLGRTRTGGPGLIRAAHGQQYQQLVPTSQDGGRHPHDKVVNRKTLDFKAALRQNLGTPPQIVKKRYILQKNGFQDAEKENVPRAAQVQKYHDRSISEAVKKDAALAERLLRRLMIEFREGKIESPPDGSCFNKVISAYANKGNIEKAEELLEYMWQEFHFGRIPPPDRRIYTSVMLAWQKSNRPLEAPEVCEELLDKMYELSRTFPDCGPDTKAYTCPFHCWANSRRDDATHRAEILFREMLRRFKAGDKNLMPDTICFSNLINVFVNCGKDYEGAERLLWEMIQMHVGGLESTAPTVRSFNTLLSVWGKSSDPKAPDRVKSILKTWKGLNESKKVEVVPDGYSYALLLRAWTNSDRKDAIDELLKSFQWIKGLWANGDKGACPDLIKCTTVISALNRAGLIERSQSLLVDLIKLYKKDKKSECEPDARCFHTVLSALSRRKTEKSSGQMAEVLLRHMWELSNTLPHLTPTQWTYNAVIQAYRVSNDPEKHYHIRELQMEAANALSA